LRLVYLIPERGYEFFSQITPYLTAAGVDVNISPRGYGKRHGDTLLAAMLPATPQYLDYVEDWVDRGLPTVLWHWDLYSFVDLTQPRWSRFLKLLPVVAKLPHGEVWSCSYETGRQLKEVMGIDSYAVPAWIDGSWFGGGMKAGRFRDFVFYASSSASLGKRVDWADRACQLCKYSLVRTEGQAASRQEYLTNLVECRVYLCTAFEESNGTIPAVEAGACGKAVVMADIPANREVFGNTAHYFRNDNFGHLVEVLRAAWEKGPLPGVRQRMLEGYDLPMVAEKLIRRLKCLCH
jgi:hypothetical protein